MITRFVSILLISFFITFCKGQSNMEFFKIEKDNATQVNLSKKLKEISGIAFSPDGRLFGHDDERAVIYQINPRNGKIIKSFYFGLLVKKGDFEDIEIVGEDFYMVTSSGIIYKFKEGADGQRVDFEASDSGLKKHNNVEGLCYDPATNTLLLALKGGPGPGLDNDYKAVYSFYLASGKRESRPRFVMDKKKIKKLSDENDFEPSGIGRNPLTGDFYVIAASGNLMVQINPAGEIQSVQKLSRKLHNQPEGITFSKDGTLYISDEGKKQGTLTIYPKNPK